MQILKFCEQDTVPLFWENGRGKFSSLNDATWMLCIAMDQNCLELHEAKHNIAKIYYFIIQTQVLFIFKFSHLLLLEKNK